MNQLAARTQAPWRGKSSVSIPDPAERSPVATRFFPGVLNQVRTPEIGLAIWQRYTRLHLRVLALALLSRPFFTATATGSPDVAARGLCRDLLLFDWPLYADFRHLGFRFAKLAGCAGVRMRFEHVVDDSCCKFHVDVVKLRMLCTYAGPGTEWKHCSGRLHRLAPMDVAVFKGSAYPDQGPRVPHRSPALNTGHFAGQSRLLLCIDTAS